MQAVLRDDADRRGAPRHRTLLTGKVVHGGRDEFSFDCAIRDCSDEGARLSVTGSGLLPGAFRLLNLRTGDVYDAEVAWRNYPYVGVRFRQAENVAVKAEPSLQHVRELWTLSTLR
jgi:hypothetical protein